MLCKSQSLLCTCKARPPPFAAELIFFCARGSHSSEMPEFLWGRDLEFCEEEPSMVADTHLQPHSSLNDKPAIAQLAEHLTVDTVQKSDRPWFDSGWPE